MNRYKKYLLEATSEREFRHRFGMLARNARGWMDLLEELEELKEMLRDHLFIEDVNKKGVEVLHRFYNKELPALTPQKRKKLMRKQQIDKQRFKEEIEEYGVYDTDSEELIPIIHGGDLGRIIAAIYHGRGYATENWMPNVKKGIDERTGLMFHSRVTDRAHYYARLAAWQRMGVQAILLAFVPRKYLYHNQGDEYSLPYWHYKYLRDIKIVTEFETEFYHIEEYYRKHYLSGAVLKHS